MAETGINVMVPLGGLGSRFQKEGYLTRCKPFIPVLGKPMLLWVLDGLTLGEKDNLIIVYNPGFMGIGNFMQEVVADKYPNCKFVELPGPTGGAAETVLIGLKGIDEEMRKRPTLLADGDTFYTADIVSRFREVAGTHNAVFCFNDTQEKPIYSYITIGENDEISEVKEKVKISDWANSGCYCFRDGSQLATECEALIQANSTQASQDGVGEYYTSGVIATMLGKKEPFKALKLEVSDIHVLGTPAQVKAFCEAWPLQPRQRFVFDLEGALVTSGKNLPIKRNIEACIRLKAQGHIIIIQSTRGPGSESKVRALLERHSIPCDTLKMGKPMGEFYIAGTTTVDGTLMDLDRQVGFYPTEVRVTKPQREQRPVALRKPKMTSIAQLNPESRGVNCTVKIVGEMKEVDTKKVGIWEVTCGDESGQIILSLIEAQKEGLEKDAVVAIRNGGIRMIGGHMRLVVDKWGKLDTKVEETIEKVGEKNVSDTEFELVMKR